MKHESLWTLIKENIPFLLTIFGMAATLLNLWLATSVQPLATQIGEVQAKVSTIERTIDLTSDNRLEQQESLNNRLDRIEDKLDTLIQSRLGGQ